jgi:hypothetical protein
MDPLTRPAEIGPVDLGPVDIGRAMSVVAKVVLRHPRLWVSAIGQALRLARPGWRRSWPPVPVPTEGLWRMRMLTAYGGDGTSQPDPGDVLSYLDWCSAARSWRKR